MLAEPLNSDQRFLARDEWVLEETVGPRTHQGLYFSPPPPGLIHQYYYKDIVIGDYKLKKSSDFSLLFWRFLCIQIYCSHSNICIFSLSLLFSAFSYLNLFSLYFSTSSLLPVFSFSSSPYLFHLSFPFLIIFFLFPFHFLFPSLSYSSIVIYIYKMFKSRM